MISALLGIYRRHLAERARRLLYGRPGVQIGEDVKINAARIRFKNGCRLEVGDKSIIEASIAYDREGGEVLIGARTFIGASALVCAERIVIGDDVLISWGCTIVDHDSHALRR